ncbi:MAG: T9SS type A sorting domain-containing protein [Flavobacteriaceae bacterium]|nr:T9SS type A sorting domain-containing protein [Flavobacteriaceae bacterium]
MKAIITLLLCFAMSVTIAQDKVFTHKATVANISGNVSYIDHPDLNGNPGALILVTHNLSVGGTVYNDKITGTWYNSGISQWSVFNEDISAMAEGSAYNVYVPFGGKVITEQADGTSYTTVIDDVAVNGNPNAVIVYSTYWNPNSVYNNNNYGFWYDAAAERWNIYNEATATNAPNNATFTLLVDDATGGADSFVHQATAGNTTSNYTIIDHPSLNGKPDAFPIVSHNWGSSTGEPANIVMNVTLGVWYNGSNWTIYTEDTSAMVENTKYNVYVAEELLSVNENIIAGLNFYPNPVDSNFNVSANSEINSVTVFDVLGKQVFSQEGDAFTMEMDLSVLATGNYLARVQSGDTTQVIKLVKI